MWLHPDMHGSEYKSRIPGKPKLLAQRYTCGAAFQCHPRPHPQCVQEGTLADVCIPSSSAELSLLFHHQLSHPPHITISHGIVEKQSHLPSCMTSTWDDLSQWRSSSSPSFISPRDIRCSPSRFNTYMRTSSLGPHHRHNFHLSLPMPLNTPPTLARRT